MPRKPDHEPRPWQRWKSPWREDEPDWLAPLRRLLRWTRREILWFLALILAAWVVGSTAIHLAEQGGNPAFDTWGETLWNVWLILFSGVEQSPRTPLGRLVTVLVLVSGVCLVGLF